LLSLNLFFIICVALIDSLFFFSRLGISKSNIRSMAALRQKKAVKS
jgi:hypothetical protein